jgi:hypothetical protein
MSRTLALEGYAPLFRPPWNNSASPIAWRGVAGNAFGRQAERTLNHPSTTTPRRSCKQLPSRFQPVARWLLRRSVALQHAAAGRPIYCKWNESPGIGRMRFLGKCRSPLLVSRAEQLQFRLSSRRLRHGPGSLSPTCSISLRVPQPAAC